MTPGAAPARLSVRLRRTGGFLVLLTVLVGLVGAGVLGEVSRRYERGRTHATPALEATAEALQAVVDGETAVRGYALTGERSLLEPYLASRPRATTALDDVASLTRDDPRAQRLVGEHSAAVQEWYAELAEPVADGPGPADVDDVAGRPLLDAVRAANARLQEHLATERTQLRESTEALRRAGTLLLLGLTVLLVAAGVAVGVRTVRWVVEPTDALSGVVQRLRAGDHAARADTGAGPEEVRQVARAVNALADEGDLLRGEADEVARLRAVVRRTRMALRLELGVEAVAGTAVGALGPALGVDLAWYRPVAPERRGARDGDGWGEAAAVWAARDGLRAPRAELLDVDDVRRLWHRGEVLAVPDVAAPAPDGWSGATGGPRRRLAEAAGVRTGLAVPVGGADELRGVLTVLVTSGPRAFSAAEVAAVQSVAADLGRALEQADLFDQQMELVDRLKALDRQKSDFLSTVSHELRTPLTSIAGYAELIREGDAGPVPPRVDAMLEVVQRNTARLHDLIEDLLTLSRIESGGLRLVRSEVAVERLVAGAVEAVRPLADRGGVRLEVEAGGGDLRVEGDAAQLERVLLNLLSNAVKFTPPGGTASLRVSCAEGAVVLACEDSGIGIPADEQQDLFSRFFRASNAVRGAVPGTGLGLALVREVVEEHGGAVDLTSQEGVGTRVVVRLPSAGTSPGPDALVQGQVPRSGTLLVAPVHARTRRLAVAAHPRERTTRRPTPTQEAKP